MDRKLDHQRLRYLWKQWVAQACSNEELNELFDYIRNCRNEDLAELIVDEDSGLFISSLDEGVKQMMLQHIWQQSNQPAQKKPVVRFRKLYYAAAAAAIVFIVGGYLLWKQPESAPLAGRQKMLAAKDVLPGSARAMLTLSDGSTIELDSASEGILATQAGTSIEKTNQGEVVYLHRKGATNEVLYNTMRTPPGGVYKLTLPDGSRVWLNAASSITYPTAFTVRTRKVSITGEAYFEVTKNPARAFIVKTYNESVVVHGTSFNVNSYEDEAHVKTSLLEGSVFIGKQELKPGQAYVDGKVFQEDVMRDVAWKNGSFAFANADIKAVLRQLARWYDLQIVFEGAVPKGKFSGEIGRSLTLNQLLKGLSTTKIKYRLENENKLVIMDD